MLRGNIEAVPSPGTEMTSKVPSAFYEQFLEEESGAFSSTHEFISKREQFLSYSQVYAIRFGALALAHPFQSIRLLRQVQCGSTVDTVDKAGFCKSPTESEEKEAQKEANNNFKTASVGEMEMLVNNPIPIEKDDIGYARPQEKTEPKFTSKWPIYLNKKCSIWSTARLIAINQGMPSLWNGLSASCLYDFTSESLYLAIERLLANRYLYFDTINLTSSLLRGLISFTLTPLDLIRTRLMAQSIFRSERNGANVFSGLHRVFKREGGIHSLFPNKLFSVFYSFLPPLLKHVPLILLSELAESVAEAYQFPSGVAFASVQFLMNCAEAMLLSPLETIRRRLYLQSRESGIWIYRVPISEQPYTGFWNALRRIYQEEDISALYQGLSLNIVSALVNFTSTALMTLESEYSDDLEAF